MVQILHDQQSLFEAFQKILAVYLSDEKEDVGHDGAIKEGATPRPLVAFEACQTLYLQARLDRLGYYGSRLVVLVRRSWRVPISYCGAKYEWYVQWQRATVLTEPPEWNERLLRALP